VVPSRGQEFPTQKFFIYPIESLDTCMEY
jgi:hypothetical protein